EVRGRCLVRARSPAARRGSSGPPNCAAAKAGCVRIGRTGAMGLARANITVTAIVPVAATEMTKTIPVFAPIIEESERTGQPLPQWLRRAEGLGTVEDVAPLVLYLASAAPAAVTAQALGTAGDRRAPRS